ncbi:MAG: NAD-dependent epimerase/dehydratase family protein [Euryarchaeota archaeon]|nr:NAD-dependent epimerase/dehydratase family protein [Euryarchaeota archaeon]MBU4032930.1 NAD-dependent epimerase/dehydratase family protein [Candidatus Thermoplasmatota archaeon]MBU4071170.1 NAD-dependent epimerase/dehydratase family protein [Candidatus Thermoplasmatota archaeon]MBU4143866.1 NAD-dependent epimerase/dehydratase family protein [Candidatus Thermoplasmatota archaeon]
MKLLITGGAGFIGSHLINRLIGKHEIVVLDNLSESTLDAISCHINSGAVKFIEASISDAAALDSAMDGVDTVFHLAAHRDVRAGVENPSKDMDNGILATYQVLESMRRNNVKNIVFSSSQVVYGEVTDKPVSEDFGPMIPISIYGASKLACEALVMAYSHTYGMHSWIFRFANIVGEGGTHGVIPDFVLKLKKNSKVLEILGDGTQTKPYLEVGDCVSGMLFGWENSSDAVNLFNLGTEGWTSVTRLAEIVVEECGLKDVEFRYTGGKRGWVGDVPRIRLSSDKIRKLGWKTKYDSDDAVRVAARSLKELLW